MQALTAIVTTYNEAHHITEVLQSLSWADEILVVDSFSTDNTVELARPLATQVVQRAYQGPADQKNWAIPQATHPWVLLLDADERVTDELREEVQTWLRQPDIPYDVFWIGRRNFFLGREIRYSGWQGDKVVRFFRRDAARYNDKQVHEEVITDGLRVGQLKHRLLHYTYRDIAHFLAKMDRYARWSAQDYAAQTPRVTYFHLLAKPIFRFFKHFVLQGGVRDGRAGLVVSVIMAWGVFLRYLYLMDEEGG